MVRRLLVKQMDDEILKFKVEKMSITMRGGSLLRLEFPRQPNIEAASIFDLESLPCRHCCR